MTDANRHYVNKDRTVRLNDQQYYWFQSAVRAFRLAFKKNKSYVDASSRAIIFVPDAVAEYGQFYWASENLKHENAPGYHYLVAEIYNYCMKHRKENAC